MIVTDVLGNRLIAILDMQKNQIERLSNLVVHQNFLNANLDKTVLKTPALRHFLVFGCENENID